jgi:hypothetical protein
VTADQLLEATLRGETPSWPPSQAAQDLLARAAFHGVVPLVYERLPADWPANLRHELRACAMQNAVWELSHKQSVTQALGALTRGGVESILLKGTALAYSIYADPSLRPRGDTDLLIPLKDRAQADQILRREGYQRVQAVSGEFISYQASYSKQASSGPTHTLDLHWKINNSEVLSQLFTYDELRSESLALPALCAEALMPATVQSLLIACMHRCTHRSNPYYVQGQAHHSADRLIWLFDIHLLAAAMTARDWQLFERLAADKGLRAVCADGMRKCIAHFGTRFPDGILQALEHAGPGETPAKYLDASKPRQQWMDFAALESLQDRLRFAKELAFPDADYMRHKYPGYRNVWLPWLYIRRGVDGLKKQLAPGRPGA